MQSENFAIEIESSRTTAVHYRAVAQRALAERAFAPALLVLAHGAGAPQTHPWMVTAARVLAERGLDVVTFNFIYAEAKRRLPDKNVLLEATWRAAIDAVTARDGLRSHRLFIGGKSMGGRIATQVAAGASPIAGLKGIVLLGYPLHPPGRPDKLRVGHLDRVPTPMLFVQGSRDPFGTPDELTRFVPQLRSSTPNGTRIVAIEGGDHSLALGRKEGAGVAASITRMGDEVATFTASR